MRKVLKTVVVAIVALIFSAAVVLLLEEKAFAEEKDYGNYGRFVVNGTDIDAAIYYYDMDAVDVWAVQEVVDDPDKCVAQDYSNYHGWPVALNIADHNNQGFDQLYDVVPGETTCEIQHQDGTVERYLCESVDHQGTNSEEYGVLNSAGNHPELVIPSDWIWTYTCNPEEWWTVTVVCWSPIIE